MAAKAPENAIVTYRSFAGAFDKPVAQPLTHGSSAFESLDDPGEDSALRARLSAALAALEDETVRQGPGVMAAVQNQFASLLQSRMLEEPPPGNLSSLSDAHPAQSAFEVKYDECDILGWVTSVFTWWKMLLPQPWLVPPDQPDTIGRGRKLRVAMIADWGTGLYGAPVCARSIGSDPETIDLMLHLGDVYYSGTLSEVRTRFLNLWPKRGDAVSRACNGNHEMYTGGEGYFRAVLPAFNQPASYFAVQTDDWVLAGLDSAYEEHDLAGDQAGWLERIVNAAGDRRVVLFTHHQPYSLFDTQGPRLVEKLGRLLGRRKIFAWYWGHEHRCVLYDAHPAWGLLGRCIGHGGYPYFRDRVGALPIAKGKYWRRVETRNLVPGGLILDAPNEYVPGEEDKYGANGYVTLEFDERHLNERMHAPDGAVLRERQLA
jgi:calcineurin-like phosphoesterase family protein